MYWIIDCYSEDLGILREAEFTNENLVAQVNILFTIILNSIKYNISTTLPLLNIQIP